MGGKKRYIDGTGRLVISPQWDTANTFSEGRAAVCIGECDIDHQNGFRNKGYPQPIEELEQTFKYGFIDESGKLVVNPAFEAAQDFSEGLAAVCVGLGCYSGTKHEKEETKWGFIDKSGAMVILPQFAYVTPFKEGLAMVCIGGVVLGKGKCGFIDKTASTSLIPSTVSRTLSRTA